MGIAKLDRDPLSDKKAYTIGEMARLYGLSTDSLRYYEKKGIIKPIRGKNGYRLYSARDIWRMNVISGLRSWSLPVERIYAYFQNRTVESAEGLLEEKLCMIDEEMERLRKLRSCVEEEKRVLEKAKAVREGEVILRELGDRRAFVVHKPYNSDEEMDLLMKELVSRGDGDMQMIGNNRLASVLAEEKSPYTYRGALLFDPKGSATVPGGRYLSVYYRGTANSRYYARLLRSYAKEHHMKPGELTMERVWIDIHTSEQISEHLSEVQLKLEE